MTHPVAAAVEPLREDAKKRAVQTGQCQIDRLRETLAQHGDDMEAAYPWPKSYDRDYKAKVARIHWVEALVARKPGSPATRRINDPRPVVVDEARVAAYLEQVAAFASAQYDAFIAKLVGKIGACDSATIEGSHVWGYSVLTVTKGDVIERWKTRQIVNVSKLGIPFNQWPTRRVKR